MKAAILCGGQGKRLRPLTENIPKTMVQIAGKPILEWQLQWLKKYGIDSAIILAGYKHEKIMEFFREKKPLIDIDFSIENEPIGTGGGLKNAEKSLKGEKEFLVVNGDILTNFNLKKMRLEKEDVAQLSLIQLKSPYGVVHSSGNKVTKFEEKPMLKEYWVSAGIYLMSSSIFNYLPKKGDIEKTAFPSLAEEGKLGCTRFEGEFWKPIDSIKDVDEANDEVKGHIF
jgi:NDP-sugar pyrophosphorylase family protein